MKKWIVICTMAFFLQSSGNIALADIVQNPDGSFTDTYVKDGIRYTKTFKDVGALKADNAKEIEFRERMKEIRDLAKEKEPKKNN